MGLAHHCHCFLLFPFHADSALLQAQPPWHVGIKHFPHIFSVPCNIKTLKQGGTVNKQGRAAAKLWARAEVRPLKHQSQSTGSRSRDSLCPETSKSPPGFAIELIEGDSISAWREKEPPGLIRGLVEGQNGGTEGDHRTGCLEAGTGLLPLQKAAQGGQCCPETAKVTAAQSLPAPL